MITLEIKLCGFYQFECSFESIWDANIFLKMVSFINEDSLYVVKSINVKDCEKVLNREYIVQDNSYCVNIENGKDALLVQIKDDFYNPDEEEDGAKFHIVREPYIEEVNSVMVRYCGVFVDIISNKTGNIYRVLYNSNCLA